MKKDAFALLPKFPARLGSSVNMPSYGEQSTGEHAVLPIIQGHVVDCLLAGLAGWEASLSRWPLIYLHRASRQVEGWPRGVNIYVTVSTIPFMLSHRSC